MLRQPGQRRIGMAQHVSTHTGADLDAVDQRPAMQPGEIRQGIRRKPGPEHAAGREKVVGDKHRRADALPVDIAVIDDLDCRHHFTDSAAHAVGGRALPGKIMRQPDRDLAFDADTDEVAMAQHGAARMARTGEEPGGTGMVDTEIILHHRRGAADLPAAAPAEARDGQSAVHGALYGIGPDDVGGRLARLGRQGRAREPGSGDRLGKGIDGFGLRQGGLPAFSGQACHGSA